jgi:ATP-dependent RNA helicase DDX35
VLNQIDEAHERSVYTDLLLAVLKKYDSFLRNGLDSHSSYRICKRRPSLRIVISSATLDAAAFQEFFRSNMGPDAVTIISLEGRMYPIEVAYLQEPVSSFIRAAAETIVSVHARVCARHVIFFLC